MGLFSIANHVHIVTYTEFLPYSVVTVCHSYIFLNFVEALSFSITAYFLITFHSAQAKTMTSVDTYVHHKPGGFWCMTCDIQHIYDNVIVGYVNQSMNHSVNSNCVCYILRTAKLVYLLA